MGDLLAVHRSGCGARTVVHVLDGSRQFSELANTFATAPHANDGAWDFVAGDYTGDHLVDVVAVNRSDAGSGRTAVHVLDGASAFSQFAGSFATALQPD